MNLGVLMCFCSRANASIEISYDATDIYYGQSYSSIWYGHYTSTAHAISHINLVTLEDLSNYYTKQGVNNIQSLNYYYTFRVGKRVEVIDSASFFQKDFSTLQEVDLQSKNLTHLRAFSKCDEACPRPLERFVSSLSQEQMFKNDASVDVGTSRHCLRQFGDVVADLLKNTVAKSLRIYEFMNEEVCHA